MTAKAIVLTALVLFALCVPWVVDSSFATVIPSYFSDEWVGLVCLSATIPGSPSINLLAQFNFDKTTNGGITLAKADSLFTLLTSALASAGNSVHTTCSLKPSQVQSIYGLNALQVAQQLTGQFHQFGFALYIILDSFYSLVPGYLGLPAGTQVLRSDVFLVNGSNNVSYTASLEILKSLVP